MTSIQDDFCWFSESIVIIPILLIRDKRFFTLLSFYLSSITSGSIRQLTQFSSKRIPPIWNRLIFPGFWEYRYGLVVELKMNFKSVWIHNSICSFLYWISEKNAKFKKDWFLQPDTISYSTISVIIKISPPFQRRMTEIFRLAYSCSNQSAISWISIPSYFLNFRINAEI